MLTFHMHFIMRCRKGQLRTVIVQVGGVLTETDVVDRCPGVFVVNNYEMKRESREVVPSRESQTAEHKAAWRS